MTYQCPHCKTLFTVHNPLKNKVVYSIMNSEVEIMTVPKTIHCPNSECLVGWETIEPSPEGQGGIKDSEKLGSSITY